MDTKKNSTRSTFKLQCRTVSTKLDGVRDEKHFLCRRIFVCLRNAGFYVFTPRYVMVGRVFTCLYVHTVSVCLSGQRKNGNYSADFFVFLHDGLCVQYASLHYEFIHTLRLDDNPLVWSVCLHMAIVHFSTPSWCFSCSQFHSHYALEMDASQRKAASSEWMSETKSIFT